MLQAPFTVADADWTRDERRLAWAAGAAPIAVSGIVASLSAWFAGATEAVMLFVMLVPAAYFTLFALVLPSLWLLKRFGRETWWSFAAVCGLSVVLPWLAMYAVFFGQATSGKFGGGIAQMATLLLLPGGLAAAAGALIYRSFGARRPR